jgi:hypothetical protein
MQQRALTMERSWTGATVTASSRLVVRTIAAQRRDGPCISRAVGMNGDSVSRGSVDGDRIGRAAA